jgi:hypothetical protein
MTARWKWVCSPPRKWSASSSSRCSGITFGFVDLDVLACYDRESVWQDA